MVKKNVMYKRNVSQHRPLRTLPVLRHLISFGKTSEGFAVDDFIDVIPVLREIVEELLTAVVVYPSEDRW